MAIFACFFAFIPASEAHILVIGDSLNDYADAYAETTALATQLKAKGYDVRELYRENATSKNILKGMYGADAVIYAGHGGYQSGNYDEHGGTATPPFALVGSDDFIWGVGDKMREGWGSNTFTAPFKQNIPVILLHACFSTGWVEEYEVANPAETIYNFANMFVGAGANYYATAWNGAEIVHDFLNGATDFTAANNQNYEKITTSTTYNGVQVWHNNHGYAAFVGDWSGKFPSVAETTAYDDAAAENWYNSDRTRNVLTSRFSVSGTPYYTNQPITFTDTSTDVGGDITSYSWNFGDGTADTSANPTHTFTNPGTYTVTHTVIDNNTKISTSTKNITVTNQPITPIYTPPTPTPVPPVVIAPSQPNYSYKYLKKYKYKGKWKTKWVYVLIQKYLKKYKSKGKWKYKWVTKKISWS
ncbi:MAG: PKD domain-containing protein [Methanobacterium sp.]|nr:PKD domain-containing protein [Methanobacterium sp.]